MLYTFESVREIQAETEEEAWKKLEDVLLPEIEESSLVDLFLLKAYTLEVPKRRKSD